MEFRQFLAYHSKVNCLGAYIGNPLNYLDLLSIILLNSLVWQSAFLDFDVGAIKLRQLTSLVALFRWFQCLYMLRPFSVFGIGPKVVPLFDSVFKIGGILVSTVVAFLAFVHVFLILNGPSSESFTSDIGPIIRDTLRFLVLGDGDGIDFVLGLGGREEHEGLLLDPANFQICIFATGSIVFCICALNLFIAVHGNVYEEANLDKFSIFYVSRAEVCLWGMMQPHFNRGKDAWPWKFLFRNRGYFSVLLVGTTAWLGAISLRVVPPIFGALLLFLFMHFGDCLLIRRVWSQPSNQVSPETNGASPSSEYDRYLWWMQWDGYGIGGEEDSEDPEEAGVEHLSRESTLTTQKSFNKSGTLPSPSQIQRYASSETTVQLDMAKSSGTTVSKRCAEISKQVEDLTTRLEGTSKEFRSLHEDLDGLKTGSKDILTSIFKEVSSIAERVEGIESKVASRLENMEASIGRLSQKQDEAKSSVQVPLLS
jgi:hypothetical protein